MESPGVCREFFNKFPNEQIRRHEELVTFIIRHSSTSRRIDEWIQTEEINTREEDGKPYDSKSEKNTHDYDDSLQTTGMPPPRSKCSSRSKKEREIGNEFFKTKNLAKSLLHYNEAIKFATFPNPRHNQGTEEESTCLAIALANRSAVYTELGEEYFDKALKDADYALNFGYPGRLKQKLVLRKASIYVKQGKRKEAQECLDSITDAKSGADEKFSSIQIQIDNLPNGTVSDHSNREASNISLFQRNPNFEYASENITIKTSTEFDLGRHVVAMKDLDKGETLFCETPFASVLLSEFYTSHCHHCHKPLYDTGGCEYFYPCQRCTLVKFCNSVCWKAAEELYHQYECRWLDLMHSVGIAHLALRIILVAGVEDVLKCARNHSTLCSLNNLDIFKEGMNSYLRVYSLLDHIDDMFPEDLFQYTLTAGLLTKFLASKTKFLDGISEEDVMKVGGVMLRHICQLICNAHAITDVLPENNSTDLAIVDEYQKRIATAIFPAASIMNHSCDPNISFYFENGKTLIVKSSRPIKKGSDVYNCYGPHFRRMPRNERQEILCQQYFFKCDCERCAEEISSGKEISFADQFTAHKCSKCAEAIIPPEPESSKDLTTPCSRCGEKQNWNINFDVLKTIYELQEKGEYLFNMGDVNGSLEAFECCLKVASRILHKYNSQYGKLCDSLARCYVSLGRNEDAKTCLEESLSYIAKRFGSDSTEFQKESRKYFDIFGVTYDL